MLPVTNNNMLFLIPFIKPQFVSSDIKQLTKIPSKIDCKAGYYSLAALIIYCLLNEEIDKIEEIETILKPIFYTKIYWFLKHCLNNKILLLI